MTLESMKVAILASDRFELAELESPMKALKAAGAHVFVVAPHHGEIVGMNHNDVGHSVKVDRSLADTKADEFDALLLPGGVANPDELRTMPRAVAFVKHFADTQKPIGVICHGSWTLIEADSVKDRHMTSWPSLQTDLLNAGARWVDQEVVVDHNLVSSRKPDDLPAFNKAFITLLQHQPVRRAA
ncbi:MULTISPECIES: type 1 glutamine amidotransferase domain-containing protein [Acidiphilium]|uniref:Protease I n=1 Tax=Acidiphilium rubrum TaxID=526 RepID=A0A8G2CKV1_ACIRU|nr:MULTISPECIES: type 1 glutamine amidotransferase domain-containing protein [Acidiphilium]MBW4035923.1 type 1 glutamine amidotransferase [Pseudomonadota bacterium]OZB29203.1 MAG: glutamine amidotransferase [Acidiphilium sp. 34-64-41]SIQ85499.1 protease I [Acidiphilium rubrum]HQT84759.1 type 1 glutamine amidotransferase domain-containing protein [Acidiphilium rubrum]